MLISWAECFTPGLPTQSLVSWTSGSVYWLICGWPTGINYFFFPFHLLLCSKTRERRRDPCPLTFTSSRKKRLSPPTFEGSLVWTAFPVDPVPSSLHSFAHFLAVPARKRASDLNLWVVIGRPVSYSWADKAFGSTFLSDSLRRPQRTQLQLSWTPS